MALPHQKFRELVVLILYAHAIDPESTQAERVSLLMRQFSVSKKNVREAEERAQLVLSHLPEIDRWIQQAAIGYAVERIHKITLAILRLGIFELLIEKTLPFRVVIAEAVRLSCKFGSEQSGSFVNAILDPLYSLSLGVALDEAKLREETARWVASEEQLPPPHPIDESYL